MLNLKFTTKALSPLILIGKEYLENIYIQREVTEIKRNEAKRKERTKEAKSLYVGKYTLSKVHGCR